MKVFNIVQKTYCKFCNKIKYIKKYCYYENPNSPKRFIMGAIGLKVDENYENNINDYYNLNYNYNRFNNNSYNNNRYNNNNNSYNNNRYNNNNNSYNNNSYNNNSYNNSYNNNSYNNNSYNNSNNNNNRNNNIYKNDSYNTESYNQSISNNNIIVNKDSSHNQQNQTHLRGLVNIASTCYMNSVLQCFSHIPKLYNYFQKEEISTIVNDLYSENLLFPVFREVLV